MKRAMLDALNDQLNREYYASYLYLAMAAFFEEKGYVGFAKWMVDQVDEEREHMMKIYRFIFDRGGHVDLRDIKAPKFKGKDTLHVIEDAVKHEKLVSKYINELVDLAIKEKDHATHQFLQWFVAEQVEEEAAFQAIEQKLLIIGDNKAALYLIDKELGERHKP